MTTGILLGPFVLEAPIGRGGMGEVWRARHARRGVAVAVKVMTGDRARQPGYAAWFRREVQAMAGLDHPGIVLVLDHGEAGAAAEKASGGYLAAGSPYLAMELARGTLAERGAHDWPRLRGVLLGLLDALAHAHARGIVHRDLKPTNVLEVDGRYKLADFGLAHAVGRGGSLEREEAAGTPWYMAPEQILGRWRDDGPWTDLYALGCVAWEMACGRPLVAETGASAAAEAQLGQEPPALRPLVPVPSGFEGWLRRLLRKSPRDRFQRAADAAHSLAALGDAEDGEVFALPLPERGTVPDLSARDTARTLASTQLPLFETAVHADAEDADPLVPAGEPLAARAAPPFPADWRRPEAPTPPAALIGAGLSLYGLRPVPFVGREAERDLLWRALAEVRAGGRARVVVLHGPSGTGKSRLAEWLAERAHEVGAAVTLDAIHGPTLGPHEGLAGMAMRFLRCQGLGAAETLERTERILRAQGASEAAEWRGLAALLVPETAGAAGPGPAERHALLHGLLRRLTRKRPVLARLDDVQWGLDAVAFVRHVLEAAEPTPVLFVLTVQEEALARRPLEQAALASLGALAGVTRLEVAALGGAETRALLQGLVPLEAALAAQVAERTAGNPLFAVHLVGDWVQRGVLQAGDDGLVLAREASAALPDDLHQVWAEHLAHVLDRRPPQARLAVEIAAALGQSVDPEEWDRACRAAGFARPHGLLAALAARRLVRRTPDGWVFAHTMLRESVERLSRAAGRWAAHHRACASMLEDAERAPGPGAAGRRGRHLASAEEWEAALRPLLRAAQERRETSDYDDALRLLDRRDEALEALGAGEDDARRAEGWLLRARIGLHQGRIEETARWAERARAAAGDDPAGRGEALRLLGDAARRRGDLEEAARLYREGIALGDGRGSPHAVAASLWGLGDVARARGDLATAAECLRRSRALYESIGDAHGVGDFFIGTADIAWQRRDLDAAAAAYGEARALFERLGNRYGVARAANGLGEVARARGDDLEAEACYRRSLETLELLAPAEAVFPRLNLGLVALLQGREAEGEAMLLAVAEELQQRGWRLLLAIAQAALLPILAGQRRWDQWDACWREASAALREAGLVEPDVAWVAELAGRRAAEAAQPARARAAYDVALAALVRLGDEAGADRVHRALARLVEPPAAHLRPVGQPG
ncbi:MAG TPA: AAA family ATPase [Vicinamibacteria bacterium]|jgi:tetratricopeptide (TPR) repeat protein